MDSKDVVPSSSASSKHAMRNFGNFVEYLRRNPAKKLPKRPKQDPKFATAEEFLEFQKRALMKSKLIIDQGRFINENFEEKRRCLSVKIEDFLRNLWKEVIPPHLRLEFSNVVNFTITYVELWGWIGETINKDYQLGMKSFLSCDLIKMFGDFFKTVEQCQRYGHVEITNFVSLLKLRDAVVKCLQDHYRVAYPIFKTQDASAPFPNHTADQRYSPYDHEWLCGSVISGPHYLPCVKYLCITRLAQLDISCMRADIIAEKEQLNIDFIESLRVPLPIYATNPKLLGNALYTREFRMKENFRKTKQVFTNNVEDNPDVRFVTSTTEFVELRGDIRRKKKNVMDLLIHCDRKDFRPFLQIIAVMATVEAQLLILLKVASPFMDKKLGMYGKALPTSVYKLAVRLFLTTTLESCRRFPLSREITSLLDALRSEVRKYVKHWYLNCEKNCEKVYNEKINVASIEQKYMMCYKLKKTDFPEEMSENADCMMKYLRLEQIEMERLLNQLCQAKRARWYWPKTNVPDFILNICKEQNVSALCSNFDQGMSAEEVESIARHAEFVLHESTLTTSIGEQILLTAKNIMIEMQCVPERSDFNKAFVNHFQTALGEKLVENKSAEELAIQFADIIVTDIEMADYRARIHRPVGCSAICAQRIAKDVCKKYLEYAEGPMPSRSVAIPTDPAPPGARVAGTDDDSEYATDEGHGAADSESTSGSEDETDEELYRTGLPIVLPNGYEESSDDSEDSEESEESDDSEESEESERSGESNEALLTAAMFNALSLDAVTNAAFLEVASSAIFVEDPIAAMTQHNVMPAVVPDMFVDEFISRFNGINRDILPDLSTAPYNLPVD